MVVEVEGIYLSQDMTDLIDETFAKRFCVDLRKWIAPFGYFDEQNGSIISNGPLPDGCYALVGSVKYPGRARMSSHTVFQFNLLKNRGMDLVVAQPLNPYPDLPGIPLCPNFPLYRVGDHTEWRAAKAAFNEIQGQYLTVDRLKDKIKQLDFNTVESRLYRVRLAVQRQIEKER